MIPVIAGLVLVLIICRITARPMSKKARGLSRSMRLWLRFLRGWIEFAVLGGGFAYLSILLRRYVKEEYFSGTFPDYVVFIYNLFAITIVMVILTFTAAKPYNVLMKILALKHKKKKERKKREKERKKRESEIEHS